MKKEINTLLTLGTEPKSLRLNSIFALHAAYLNAAGHEFGYLGDDPESFRPASIRLTLTASPINGVDYTKRAEIRSRTYPEIMQEITAAMERMMRGITETMCQQFRNGYLY